MPRLTLPCTHALRCLLELLLNAADGGENWAASSPPPAWSTSASFPTTFNAAWLPAPCLCPNLLIFLSAPLYRLVLYAWQTFSSSLATPTILLHSGDTHTHTHTQETHIDAHKGNIMLGLFHSLSCTSSSGSTASTCINAPHRSIKGSHLDPVCRVG